MKGLYGHLTGIVLAALYFLSCALMPNEWHFIDSVNLIFHEAGHTIFFFLGEYVQVAMGSGFQILLPFSIALYFFYTQQRYAGSLTLMWVGQNFINVSIYAGDAVRMQLPLLGGDAVIHDWNYLLSNAHLLDWTANIASTLFGIGFVLILLGIGLSVQFATESAISFRKI